MKRAACCQPRKRQPSMSTIDQTALFLVDVDHPAIFYWSTSTTAIFLVVDLPFSTCLFLLVDVDLPFSNWSTCLFLTGWWSTSIDACRRPFYSPFHHALERRTLWSCGLICHVFEWEVKGSNLAAQIIFFFSNQQKISLLKSKQKKKGSSLITLVRAVAVEEEKETRRERERSGGSLKVSWSWAVV